MGRTLENAMDVETFWELIEKSGGDDKRLATLLQELKSEEIRGFGDLLDIFHSKAYNWNLWAAAYLINGGCSEEEFDQFVYWLISRGEETYSNSVDDPDYLAEIVTVDDNTFDDSFIISIARALDRLGKTIDGRAVVTIPAELMKFKKKPTKPRGKEWEDDSDLPEMYPKLGEKYAEMLEWDEDSDDWDDEDKGKSKLRRAWDKFVEFFAKIFDKFVKFFSKKKKDEEEEEEEEKPTNRLTTNMGVNFWLYLAFLVLFLGFIAMIPVTFILQNNTLIDISQLEGMEANLIDIFTRYNFRPEWNSVFERYIGRRLSFLDARYLKWNNLHYIWGFGIISSLIAGLPFFKLLFQRRHVQLTPDGMEFLTKKEVLKSKIPVKEIESIWISKSNTIQINTKKKSDTEPVLLMDLVDVKPIKNYCQDKKIETEDSTLIKMLYTLTVRKFKKIRSKD